MAPSSKTEAEKDEARSGDVIVTAMEEAASSTSSTRPPLTTTTAPPAQPSTSTSAPASSSAPVDEVDRILRVQHNAYAVLKLDRRAKVTKGYLFEF